jgi:hypothetical protein
MTIEEIEEKESRLDSALKKLIPTNKWGYIVYERILYCQALYKHKESKPYKYHILVELETKGLCYENYDCSPDFKPFQDSSRFTELLVFDQMIERPATLLPYLKELIVKYRQRAEREMLKNVKVLILNVYPYYVVDDVKSSYITISEGEEEFDVCYGGVWSKTD